MNEKLNSNPSSAPDPTQFSWESLINSPKGGQQWSDYEGYRKNTEAGRSETLVEERLDSLDATLNDMIKDKKMTEDQANEIRDRELNSAINDIDKLRQEYSQSMQNPSEPKLDFDQEVNAANDANEKQQNTEAAKQQAAQLFPHLTKLFEQQPEPVNPPQQEAEAEPIVDEKKDDQGSHITMLNGGGQRNPLDAAQTAKSQIKIVPSKPEAAAASAPAADLLEQTPKPKDESPAATEKPQESERSPEEARSLDDEIAAIRAELERRGVKIPEPNKAANQEPRANFVGVNIELQQIDPEQLAQQKTEEARARYTKGLFGWLFGRSRFNKEIKASKERAMNVANNYNEVINAEARNVIDSQNVREALSNLDGNWNGEWSNGQANEVKFNLIKSDDKKVEAVKEAIIEYVDARSGLGDSVTEEDLGPLNDRLTQKVGRTLGLKGNTLTTNVNNYLKIAEQAFELSKQGAALDEVMDGFSMYEARFQSRLPERSRYNYKAIEAKLKLRRYKRLLQREAA